MARSSSAALVAALLAAVPAGAALAQTATDSAAPPPVVAPAGAAAQDASAKEAVAEAADATQKAADATADAAAKVEDAAAKTDAADAAAPASGDAAQADAPATDAPADSTTPAVTPAAEGTPAPTTAPAEPAPAGGESTAAAGAEKPGSYYTKGTHGDWLLRCMKTADGKDPCELYQLMKDAQGAAVAEVSVIPFSGKAAAILNFVAPLETDLGTGMGLQIDQGKNNAYPFMVCAPIGCIARLGMTEAELGTLKKGSAATVSLLPFGGDPAKNMVKLSMSLKGFTAGFDELQKVVKALQ